MEANISAKPITSLWQDYLFLTRELFKLLTNDPDMELFQEILEQRGSLQKMIEQHPDTHYTETPAGKSALEQINREDQAVRLRLQFLMNRLTNRDKINRAYDAFGTGFSGTKMDYRK